MKVIKLGKLVYSDVYNQQSTYISLDGDVVRHLFWRFYWVIG